MITEEVTKLTKQQKLSHGLRQLAEWYDKHPDAPIPYDATTITVFGFSAKPEEVRAIGSAKKEWGESIFRLTVELPNATIRFIACRSDVCTRKVVGTRTVPEKVVKATEAEIIPEHEEDIVEWECHESLLKPEESSDELA